MGKLILVRHGHTDMNKFSIFYGATDVSINEEGVRDAKRARDYLESAGITYDTVYTSDLKRTIETGDIVNYLGVTPQIDRRIRELDFGIFEGLLGDEVRAKYPREYKLMKENWLTYNYETGESVQNLYDRVVDFVESLDKSKDNLVICHWGVCNCTICHYFGKTIEDYWRYEMTNGGIAIIDFEDNTVPILRGFNLGMTKYPNLNKKTKIKNV